MPVFHAFQSSYTRALLVSCYERMKGILCRLYGSYAHRDVLRHEKQGRTGRAPLKNSKSSAPNRTISSAPNRRLHRRRFLHTFSTPFSPYALLTGNPGSARMRSPIGLSDMRCPLGDIQSSSRSYRADNDKIICKHNYISLFGIS